MLIGPLETNFSDILIEIHTFSFKKMDLKMSAEKCRPFCLGLNVLTYFSRNVPVSAPEWFIDLYIWTIYGVVIYVVWKALSCGESWSVLVKRASQGLGLTHWGRDKMAAISQTTLSNAFSWMKIFEFRLKFYWSLFLRVELTIFQHWFR